MEKMKYIRLDGFTDYFVSENGDVYSFKNKQNEPKKLSQFVDNVGYKQVILYNDEGKRKYFRVHRLVGLFFLFEDYKEGLVLNHIDGNKLNNNYKNLEWVSVSRNTKHGYDINLYKSRKCKIKVINKITNEEIIFPSIRDCANKLSLNRKTITSILKGNKKTNNYDYDFYYVE